MPRLLWEFKKGENKIMVSKKVKIINPSGLHLRTATVLSNSVLKYDAKLQFAYEKNNFIITYPPARVTVTSPRKNGSFLG